MQTGFQAVDFVLHLTASFAYRTYQQNPSDTDTTSHFTRPNILDDVLRVSPLGTLYTIPKPLNLHCLHLPFLLHWS